MSGGGTAHMHSFRVGHIILARNMREGPCLRVGVVLHKVGPVTYEVGVNDQVWKCHADQLLEYRGPKFQKYRERLSRRLLMFQ